jgi:hypothetical protein
MRFTPNGVAATTNQEIEIGAHTGLHNVLNIKLLISALHFRRRHAPFRAPMG